MRQLTLKNELSGGFNILNGKGKGHKRTLSSGDKKMLWKTRPHVCAVCHKRINDYFDVQFDHKRAYSKGGRTTIANTLILHRDCNQYKSTKTLTQIKKRLGTHRLKKRKKRSKRRTSRTNNLFGFELPKGNRNNLFSS